VTGLPEKLPVHVALLTGYIPPYQAEVYRALAACVERLTVLVSTEMESDRAWQADWDGIEVVVQRGFSLRKTWRGRAGGKGRAFRETGERHFPTDTIRRLRSIKPDIVVSEELGARSMLAGGYAKTARCPLILAVNMSVHTEQGRGKIQTRLRRWLLSRAAAVTANSESGKQYLRTLGVKEEKVFSFPYAADASEFLEVACPRQVPINRWLYCGALSERKAVVGFLQELADWLIEHPEMSVELTLAGEGREQQQLESFSLPSNLRIRIVSHRTYSQLAELYGQHAVLVLPTLADEWGMVVNESLAAATPVLGSVYSEAVAELIVEDETGWRFCPDQREELRAAFARCLSTSPTKLSQMQAAARRSIDARTPAWAANHLSEAIRYVFENTSRHG